jgi:hypothetical protein
MKFFSGLMLALVAVASVVVTAHGGPPLSDVPVALAPIGSDVLLPFVLLGVTMDVFKGDAFSMQELTAALERIPYVPSFLGKLGIFDPKPIRTEVYSVEEKDRTLSLIQTSKRGEPLGKKSRDVAKIRDFRTVRVARGDSIRASEIQNIRAFGSQTELLQVQSEVMDRMLALRRDADLTLENHRLGAVQGIVLDADGTTTIRNWFTEFGISQAGEVDWDLDNASPVSGAVKKQCNAIIRTMKREAKGHWVEGQTYVQALCGDAFYDDLTSHPEIRATYLNQVQANSLREDYANVFEKFRYGGIEFVNYQGTDDGSTVAIGTDKAKFFPVNAPNVFQWVQSPGESIDLVNTLGRPFYAIQIPDRDRNMFVDVEVYSYPMFMCTRPSMLLRAKRT